MKPPLLEVIVQEDLSGSVPHILDHEGNEIPCRETELRIVRIAEGLRPLPDVRFMAPATPEERVSAIIAEVHNPDYIGSLRWMSERLAEGETVMYHPFLPEGIDADTPIVRGIYGTAREAARTAIAAAERVADGASLAYALCRPPGHHAGRGYLGGHCYLNNAVLAVAALRRAGLKKMAVIDFDFHFGNGTADLLGDCDDVFFGSVHSCTHISYPYRETREPHERQLYIPFADDPGPGRFLDAISLLTEHALRFGAEAVVVSVGYDIIAGDPFGKWDLQADILEDVGAILAAPALPLCLVQEGGYLPEQLGECASRLGTGMLAMLQAAPPRHRKMKVEMPA